MGEANGVTPVDYLADVLVRMQTHPASRIDELLPHRWTPPRTRAVGLRQVGRELKQEQEFRSRAPQQRLQAAAPKSPGRQSS